MSKTFLHRHVRVEFSLSQTENVETKYQLNVEDGEDPQAVVQRVLDFGGKTFKSLLQFVTLPADPAPGDEAMILMNLEYYEIDEETDLEGFAFIIYETVTVQPGKGGEAVDNAASMAFKTFTKKIALLARQSANSGGGK